LTSEKKITFLPVLRKVVLKVAMEKTKEISNCLVLLATYNGEKYIEEQIDSILAQKDVHISILIADDCSMDRTVEIIKDRYANDKRVSYYINEKNLGYSKNFMRLIDRVPLYKYDYICLSDQDDVWEADKVISGSRKLEENGDKLPALYSSNLMVVDEKLEIIKTMYNRDKIDPDNPLESYCTGCTVIFNNSLLALIKEYPMEKVDLPHDYIIKNIAQFCGRYIFDETSHIKYRQHSSNQIGVNDTHKFHRRVKKFFQPSYHNYSNLYKNIRDTYGLTMHERYNDICYAMANYRSELRSYCKLLFTNKYRKHTFSDNFAFKIAILFKKY